MKAIQLTVLALFLGAQNLLGNAVADFSRCYSRLTSLKVSIKHPLVERVRSKDVSAAEACRWILRKTRMGADGKVNIHDPEAKALLANFQYLHFNWFLNRDFSEEANAFANISNRELYDPLTPASYLTYALLNDDIPAKYIWTGSDYLASLRANMDPQNAIHGDWSKADFIFPQMRMAGRNELHGIARLPQQHWSYYYKHSISNQEFSGSARVHSHFGGGFLGNGLYLLQNVLEDPSFRSDGGVQLPRKWAKAVLHDVLCQELPSVSDADVGHLVSPASKIPFRKSAGCTSCHATIDQMAAGIRGLKLQALADVNTIPKLGGFFATFHQVTRPMAYHWNATADGNYYQSENRGKLYFRDYQGNLVDLHFHGLGQLGILLSQLDDPYMCLTSRYLEHFTGRSFPIKQDQSDPKDYAVLHRLAMGLKQDQDLRHLINEIINYELGEAP